MRFCGHPSVQARGPGGERQHRCAQDEAATGYGTTKSLSFVLVRHALFCQEDPPDRHSDNSVKAVDPEVAHFGPLGGASNGRSWVGSSALRIVRSLIGT